MPTYKTSGTLTTQPQTSAARANTLVLTASLPTNTSATCTVYQDESGGTAPDAQEEVTLADGAQEYGLSSFTAVSGASYWLEFSLSTQESDVTPRVGTAILEVGGPVASTTPLPDLAVADITPVDASVEDQLSLPQPATLNTGAYRVEYRVTNEESAWTDWGTLAHDASGPATLTGLLDGELYDVRVREETSDVTGSWVSLEVLTLLPAPSLSLASTAATSITISITDNADNETGVRVERRRDYTDGWSSWETLETLPADPSEYVDSTPVPDTHYQFRVVNVTEHVEAGTTIAATTNPSGRPSTEAPTSGWRVELDAADGSTRSPSVIGDPTRSPAANSLESATVPVPKDAAWTSETWEDATARVWQDGRRLPIEQLTRVEQQPGQTILHLEGGVGLYAPDRYEFSSTDVHAAFADVVNDSPYASDVVAPEASNREFVDVDSAAALQDYYQEVDAAHPVRITEDGALEPSQTCFLMNAEDAASGSTSVNNYPGGSVSWTQNAAVAIPSDDTEISETISLHHQIPPGEVGVAVRRQFYEFNGEVEIRLDGQLIQRLNTGQNQVTTSLSWNDANTGAGTGAAEWTSALEPGEHTVTITTGSYSGGDVYVDIFAPVFDERYHAVDNFDDRDVFALETPGLYPPSGVQARLLHEGFLSATGARVEAMFNDTSGVQAIALSNNYGETYTTATNASTLETDFASPGPDIQLQVTLGGCGSRTDASPTQDFKPQRLESYRIEEDVRDSAPLSNDSFAGDRKDVLSGLVNRGNALWGLRWDDDSEAIVVEMANVGDGGDGRSLDRVVDYQWSVATVGRQVEWASIEGGAQTVESESLTAATASNVSLDHLHLVPGSDQLTDPETGQIYQRGSDYTINYLLGNVTATIDGAISDSQQLEALYHWKPQAEYAVGGANPEKKLAETFVDAQTDAICRSIAYYLVDRLSDPIRSGTVVLPELPAGWSVLEALSADVLPSDEEWEVRSAPEVQEGRVRVPVANRQEVREVVSDIQERLSSHSQRI